MIKKIVYLDHAATTPVDPRVLKAMEPFFNKQFGNPSALYSLGVEANGALNDARRKVAEILHAQPDTIAFTGGGTESNNLAIFGTARTFSKPGHIITTPIEHHAVLKPLERLQKDGWEVTYVSVDEHGMVNPAEVIKAIRPDTVLISIMYANNEIGTIEPIAEIGRQLLQYRKKNNTSYPYFHTDACQAAGYLDLDVEKLHVDLMTLNGGKIYGPKGTGCLYIRRGVKLEPLMYGGSQERHMRGGTENVPGIVGFAKALELSQKDREKETKKQGKLSIDLWKKIKKAFPECQLNGPEIGEYRLPNNLNIQFPGIEGEALVIYLSEKGIMCSTGSACTATTSEPSHVLRAVKKTTEEIKSSIRFSLGAPTVHHDLDYVVKILKQIMQLV